MSRRAPLPEPGELAGYESVVPGSARQIVDVMVQNASHGRHVEKVATWAEALSFSVVALMFSFLPYVLIGTTVYFFVNGQEVAGAITGVVTAFSFAHKIIEAIRKVPPRE